MDDSWPKRCKFHAAGDSLAISMRVNKLSSRPRISMFPLLQPGLRHLQRVLFHDYGASITSLTFNASARIVNGL